MLSYPKPEPNFALSLAVRNSHDPEEVSTVTQGQLDPITPTWMF